MTARASSSATWLDIVTVLTVLALMAYMVVTEQNNPSQFLALTGLVLSLATRRHDRRQRGEQESKTPVAAQETDG